MKVILIQPKMRMRPMDTTLKTRMAPSAISASAAYARTWPATSHGKTLGYYPNQKQVNNGK